MKALAGVLVLGMAAVASTAQAGTLVGGGATLPALGYGGDVTNRQITPTAGSFLAAFSAQAGNPQTSYCQTGSGTGKNIFANVTTGGVSYNVQKACSGLAVGTPTPTGFGASAVGRSDLVRPNFAGTDSPLSLIDYSNYVSGTSSSFPVQFPAVAGSIAIAYNNANVASLNLTDAQICSIFNGTITNWSQISSSSGPITVVYRSDGSGTTFGFSNHLSKVCGSSGSKHFQTDQAFTNVVALYGLPTGAVGESGNPAVASYVANNSGTIAYVESANVSTSGQYATVNGFDPYFDFGATLLPIASTDVVYNQAINGFDGTTGRPVLSSITGAPSTQCIALVKPDAYANPSSGYPIVAVSYLLANSAGNSSSDLAAVRNLLWAPYNPTIKNATTTIGAGLGLSFLNTSTTFTQSAVQGCIGS